LSSHIRPNFYINGVCQGPVPFEIEDNATAGSLTQDKRYLAILYNVDESKVAIRFECRVKDIQGK
jgi:hypothetical protein